LFFAVVGTLFAVSYVAGVRGIFTSAQHRLSEQIRNPDTRIDATASLASQIARAIAVDHPTFAGARDDQTCPARYAARATSLIEAMGSDQAAQTLSEAGTRLRDAGWRVDGVPSVRRAAVSASNRQGLQVAVTEVAGSDTSSIEVTVTVPCAAVGEPTSSGAPVATVGG
jgi:hypothetical protein